MENIEQIAIQTYTENLKYFKEKHPELYKNLTTLDIAINDGLYTEKYALEYKDGYFDVLELESNTFFYNQNSDLHAQSILNIYDTKRTGGVFSAQKDVQISPQAAEIIDKSKLAFNNGLWATAKIISYANTYAGKETYMRRVYKMMFLGLGLGVHLKLFFDKFRPAVIFLKERNIELFRLSLFVTNYKELSKDRVFIFCIGAITQEDEKTVFDKFLLEANNYNLYIKHVPLKDNYNDELRMFQTYVYSQMFISYGYAPELIRYIDSPKYLTRNYSHVNVSRVYREIEDNIFAKKPILFVFSGPSSAKNIGWIKENKDKFIIICAMSTCKLLYKHGIKPDIMVQIDPSHNSNVTLDGVDIDSFLKDTIKIISSNVHEATVSLFEKDSVFMIMQGVDYKRDFGSLSAPSVGEYTYGLSLILGAKEIYMLGLDLAISDTFETHGDHHFQNLKGNVENQNASLQLDSTEYIKGNLRDSVPTLSKFKVSIWQFGQFSNIFKIESQNVYNLSDGAYLEGAKPLKIEDIELSKFDTLDKQIIKKCIKNFLDGISEAKFNEQDRQFLKYQIEQAKIIERKINNFKNKKFKDDKSFCVELANFSSLIPTIKNRQNADIANIYHQFFLIANSYMYEVLNTKNLENQLSHVKSLQSELCRQLLKISNLYIKTLSSYLEE